MMTRRVLVLGGSGMLGHKLLQLLGERFDASATVRDADAWHGHPLLGDHQRVVGGVDAGRPETVAEALARVRPQVVVNCIGIVKQRSAANDPVRCIRVNALFPHLLARQCRESGCRLIHISTDCVFSGRSGGYSEADIPDPVDLYGRSKLLGEVVGPGCLTLRTSMIGREIARQAGLLEWFVAQRGGHVEGYQRAVFSGLTTIALARLIGDVVSHHAALEGLFHVASQPISKYDLLVRINDALDLGIEIEPASEPACDRSLDGARFVASTGIAVPAWDSMIMGLTEDPTPYGEWRRAHEAT